LSALPRLLTATLMLPALVLVALVLLVGLLAALLLLVRPLATALLLARTRIIRLLARILVGVARIGHCRLLEIFGLCPAQRTNARRGKEFAAHAEELCGTLPRFWLE
jgi:hypothetical protein